MRKIQYTLLTISAILLTLSASAQLVVIKEKNSYYHGKRSSINFNFGLQPTISPKKKDTPSGGFLGLGIYSNSKPELTYKFALNNRAAVFAKGSLIQSSRDILYGTVGNTRETKRPEMKGNTIGFGMSWYHNNKAAMAPMGRNFSAGIMRHKYNVSYTLSNNNPLTSELKYYSLELSYCNNQPITKYLYYQLGFSTSFNTLIVDRLTGDNDGLANALKFQDVEGLAYRDIAVIRVGLGYVL